MKKNIGILFPGSRKMGVFQYGLSIAEGLIDNVADFDYTILYFEKESPEKFLKTKQLRNVNFVSLDGSSNNLMGKLKLAANILTGRPLFVANKKNKKIFENTKIDLLVMPFPLLLGFENNVPYIVSIPDIMHKYYPNFPEYNFLTRLKRDFVYKISSKNSIFSIVDSRQGMEDLSKFYKINKEKIKSIPYIPPGYIFELGDMSQESADSLLLKYNLPRKFIFYPAQFWFHKNHLRLVKALKMIRDKKGLEVNLVLSGDPGANNKNYGEIMDFIKESGVEKQVFCLGYVEDKEMVALYKKAYALIFPTLIGPTSIPPLEAMVLGTPILCSNLFSMPEQVGNAGILFNPFSEEDMADKISQLWNNEDLRKNLVKNAQKMADGITRGSFTSEWKSVIKEALSKYDNGKRR